MVVVVVKLKIIAVGGIKESYYNEALDEYLKRLRAFCSPEVAVVKEARLDPSPSAGEIASALASEGEKILSLIPPRSFVCVLTPEGRMMTSEEFAGVIETASDRFSTLVFITGSSYGLSPEVKSRADLLMSFSKLTFPHRLFRVMLAEALYRSFAINAGREYHK